MPTACSGLRSAPQLMPGASGSLQTGWNPHEPARVLRVRFAQYASEPAQQKRETFECAIYVLRRDQTETLQALHSPAVAVVRLHRKWSCRIECGELRDLAELRFRARQGV